VRVRTTAVAVAVVGVSLLLGAVALVVSLDAALGRELRASAAVQSTEAARTLDSGGDPVAGMAGDDDRALQVLGPGGEVTAATRNAAGHPPMARLAPGGAREVHVPFDDDAYLVVAAAASGGRMVLVGYSLDSVSESTSALAALLAIGLPALLVVVGATAWRVIGRALAPVDAIRAEVDEITAARLDRRVPRPASRDEIGRLADTMNRMLDRLERARARERRLVADASHELRSPIAAIRQQAEVALAHPEALPAGRLARTAHAESLRMQALVDDLLLLARADERRLGLRHAAVDLDDLVLAEARRLRATAGAAHHAPSAGPVDDADDAGGPAVDGAGRPAAVAVDGAGQRAAVAVDAGGVSAARVDGDMAALRRVLRNIGDNAARHADGRVALALSEEDGLAVLRVDDDGPGVPPGDRGRVFDRFVRLDEARDRDAGGSGLGLAIVAEIVAAHGGSVEMGESPLGGARVTVRLPLSTG
jgi:signal transduction histidine kinase